LKYDGDRLRIEALKDREIIILDFVELPNRLQGRTNTSYLLVAAQLTDTKNKIVTFNTSSKSIKEMLGEIRGSLPVRATVREIKTNGPWPQWTLE